MTNTADLAAATRSDDASTTTLGDESYPALASTRSLLHSERSSTVCVRSRLLELATGERRVAVIAAAGYGKSLLLRQLRDHETDVVLDDVHLLDAEGLRDAVTTISAATRRVVIAGRRFPDALRALGDWTVLDADQLAFDDEEITALVGRFDMPAAAASLVLQLSSGWAAGVGALLAWLERSDPSTRVRLLGHQRDRICEQALAAVDAIECNVLASLAELPVFDDRLLERLRLRVSVNQLLEDGLPIEETGTGGLRVAEPARSSLRRVAASPVELERIVDAYLERDWVHPALELCLARGEHHQTAVAIGRIPLGLLPQLDVERLRGAMASIGSTAESVPRCIYVYAHALAIAGQFPESRRAVARALRAFEGLDAGIDAAGHFETLTMQATWHIFDGEMVAAKTLAERCAAHVSERDPEAVADDHRARLHDLLGLFHNALGSDDDLRLAGEHLRTAFGLWRSLGETRTATITLFRLTNGVLVTQGRRSDALAMLDELPLLGLLSPATSARCGVERARLLPYLGRAGEVAEVVDETIDLARVLGDDWTSKLCSMAAAVAGSVLEDDGAPLRAFQELHESGWFSANTAAEAHPLLDLMDALLRTNHVEAAGTVRRSIQRIEGAPPWLLDYAEASYHARVGEADRASELLSTLALSADVDRDRRWQITVLQALSEARSGAHEQSDERLRTATDEALTLDGHDLPRLIEPQIVRVVHNASSGDLQASPVDAVERVDVSVFDRFSVRTPSDTLTIPHGRAAALVKVLVCGGGRLTVEQIIESIWPGVAPEVGRRRLRNVVRRVRQAGGQLIERDGDCIALAAGVDTDLWRAQGAARAAMSSDPEAVDAALALIDRPLVPDDRYEEWAEEARLAHERVLLGLLDRAALLAERAGDIAGAIAALRRASELASIPDIDRDAHLARLRSAEVTRPG